MRLTVERYRIPGGVIGTMYLPPWEGLDDGATLYTVEAPWDGNKPGTAIPCGTYGLHRAEFATRGECWAFAGPYGNLDEWHRNSVGLWMPHESDAHTRYACLIHSANWPDQLQGCMALGLRPAADADSWGVGDSRKAIRLFEEYVGDGPLEIEMKGDFF